MWKFNSFVALFILVSCVRSEDIFYITFINKSDKTICIAYDCSYPRDSVKVIREMIDSRNPCDVIAPNMNKELWTGVGKKQSWYAYFRYSRESYNGYVSFYIMDIDVKNNGSIDDTQNDYNLLARYDITQEEIENLNWILTYPPTPEMSFVHMWLSY